VLCGLCSSPNVNGSGRGRSAYSRVDGLAANSPRRLLRDVKVEDAMDEFRYTRVNRCPRNHLVSELSRENLGGMLKLVPSLAVRIAYL
jgi:hypothetical protein